MATRANKENELLTPANLDRVIAGFEATPKMTKKDACAILGIAYNTTRLDSLIEKYQEKNARDAARRAALRGKPATSDEITYVIQEYLEGSTIDAISKSTFRGPTFIKAILEKYDVPLRQTSHSYFSPELIPDGAVRDRFTIGEVVYSARYDSIARVDTEQETREHGWVYRIWLLADKWKQSAYQEANELASLEHLRKLGVRV
jgi:hypothetical protein